MFFLIVCCISLTHNIAIRPLIHMGLSDNPTQKIFPKFCFLFLSKTIYMYMANITLLYLMCAVEDTRIPNAMLACSLVPRTE